MNSIFLGEITDIRTGKLDVNAGAEDGRYPFFTCASKPHKINKYAFDAEAVLVAGNGDLNVKYFKGKFNAYQRTYVIQNKDKNNLSMKYLYYFIETYMNRLRRDAIGGIIKYIKLGNLTDAEIPLPPIAQQKRIAAILDKAEELRELRRQALRELNAIAQSIFIEMFGDPVTNPKSWKTVSLSDISTQITDGEHQTPKRTTQGIKLLSARNIQDGYIDVQNVDYIGTDEYERIRKRCDPVCGDILISCSGTIGRVASCDIDEPISLVRSVALVRPESKLINNKFLEYFLRTPALRTKMQQRANASSQANLFQNQIRALPAFLPPLALQQEFARRIEAIEQLKTTHRGSLAQLDALFASLQHRAFRGDL